MGALDDLPPDQRAVLQLVLQRGRSYDDIAQLLSIDRSAVRQRALDAFDALTPATVLPGPEQALVTDYLLGQLPEKVAEQVYSFLQASDADRVWAEAIVGVVTSLVSHALPEIPAGGIEAGGTGFADDWSASGHGRDSDPADAAVSVDDDEQPLHPDDDTHSAPAGRGPLPPVATDPWEASAPSAEPLDDRDLRPSSRRGGAILLSVVAVLIAAAVVIAVANAGGGKKAPTTRPRTGTQATMTSTTDTTNTTATTTSTTPNQILAQLNLRSPNGAKGTVGIVEVVRVKGVLGMVIDAQGVPANTVHNAYAVWLYNSPTSHRRIGFVPTLVGKSEQLVTEGRLPAWARAYHHILISLETQPHPSSPGEVVLYGPFHERS